MAPTATADRTDRPTTREEAARALLDILTHNPQSEASLRRQLNPNGSSAGRGSEDIVKNGLRVLEAQRKAKRIPYTAQSRSGGWTLYDSKHEAMLAEPQEMEFPYRFEVVEFETCGIDESYQRPLTTFRNRIKSNFDPSLFGTLTLSDRGSKHKPWRYAIIDGQTRWSAATEIGVQRGPAVIFLGLNPADEADIFWKLQKERRGMLSWHRFRAQLRSGDKESAAIQALAESVGLKLGDGKGEIRAVGALEACYRADAFLLERTLIALREAWPAKVPESRFIRGTHFFFRHYPLDQRVKKEVDDERLVRRLRAAGTDGLIRKANAAKESSLKAGSTERFMAQAIQNAYLQGGSR